MSQITESVSRSALSLRVVEALPKDVGRGIVRIDPRDLAQLGAAIGDTLQIAAGRPTIARAMPAYVDQRGQALIQMDGILRANAGASLDDRVSVQRAEARPARTLLLSAVEAQRTGFASAEAAYLAQRLDGIPVMAGDQVRANLFGTRTQSFAVVETSPAGPVLIGPSTTIRFATKDAQLKRGAVSPPMSS